MRQRPLMTVVETKRFLTDAAELMDDAERMNLIAFIAGNPEAGNLMLGTGGIRKLRWALPGRGKRGGARVIYYFHSEQMPVFMLAAYPKNEKVDLTAGERKQLTKLVAELVIGYRGRSGKRS